MKAVKNNLLTKSNSVKRLQTRILGARAGRSNNTKAAEDVAKQNGQRTTPSRGSGVGREVGALEPDPEMEETEPESEDSDDERSLMEADTVVSDDEVSDVDEAV
ncbi:hypothetical protein HDU93_004568 [Gonapodya sp. JEL0774]|nr:hypothetical protein HDU93_004568 [Gonapodya sp. JEL0774]